MNEIEKYEFDRLGYLLIKDLLKEAHVQTLYEAINSLECHALKNLDKPPRKISVWGPEYHVNEEKGYHVQGKKTEGESIIIEDFWNTDPTFDFLVNHAPTMQYIHEIVKSRPTINNSEIRIRYRGNASSSHGGNTLSRSSGSSNLKYRYSFGENGIDCMMVRIIYFVHECDNEQGAFCVAPGSHKSNFPYPYHSNPDEEPGMVGLAVEAGDAILFTENLRHGGFTNRSDQIRKTLHVGYGPHWMMSQNIATMDEIQYIQPQTFARLSKEQCLLFRAWPKMPEK